MRRLRRWLARLLVAMLLVALALAVASRTGAPLALVHGVLRLKRVTLTAPRVRAVVEGDARPLALPPRGRLPVVVDHLEVVGGRVAVALLDREPPRRFAATALTLAARGRLERGGAELEVATIRF